MDNTTEEVQHTTSHQKSSPSTAKSYPTRATKRRASTTAIGMDSRGAESTVTEQDRHTGVHMHVCCMCVSAHTRHCTHVGVRGQLAGAGPLPPPCQRTPGIKFKSSLGALPTEPLHQPPVHTLIKQVWSTQVWQWAGWGDTDLKPQSSAGRGGQSCRSGPRGRVGQRKFQLRGNTQLMVPKPGKAGQGGER